MASSSQPSRKLFFIIVQKSIPFIVIYWGVHMVLALSKMFDGGRAREKPRDFVGTSTLAGECPFHCPSLHEAWDKATAQNTGQKPKENNPYHGS